MNSVVYLYIYVCKYVCVCMCERMCACVCVCASKRIFGNKNSHYYYLCIGLCV